MRTVVLNNEETAAFWCATDRLGYPYGPFYKLLLLTAGRKRDISDAIWPEVDLSERLLTIPGSRHKSMADHMIHLSDSAVEIILALPRFVDDGAGNFLFSCRRGVTPINGFSKAKSYLDRAMLAELRKRAEMRGNDPDKVELKKFRNHDLRRVVRSGLAALDVPDQVAGYVLGHGKKGLDRIYNQHKYRNEIRTALQVWAEKVRTIVSEFKSTLSDQERRRSS